MSRYLQAFPQKCPEGKDPFAQRVKKSDIAFLMNGKYEMSSQELYDLLSQTQIEDFDAVEEAFNLLDVEGKGGLEIDTFRKIFERLDLGTIEDKEKHIFEEVAGVKKGEPIKLEDFRRILEYKAEGSRIDGLNIENTENIEDQQTQIDEDENGTDSSDEGHM